MIGAMRGGGGSGWARSCGRAVGAAVARPSGRARCRTRPASRWSCVRALSSASAGVDGGGPPPFEEMLRAEWPHLQRALKGRPLPRGVTLDLSDDLAGTLAAYMDRIWKVNPDMNLISRKAAPRDLVVNHVLDSLLGLAAWPTKAAIAPSLVADLGSGSGMPGIPLAAVLAPAGVEFVLFEKHAGRNAFMRAAAVDLGLADRVHVEGLITPDLVPGVDLAVSRAFRTVASTVRLTEPYYRAGGAYLFYKGRRERVNAEVAEAESSIPPRRRHIRVIELPTIGDMEERHAVAVRRLDPPKAPSPTFQRLQERNRRRRG